MNYPSASDQPQIGRYKYGPWINLTEMKLTPYSLISDLKISPQAYHDTITR